MWVLQKNYNLSKNHPARIKSIEELSRKRGNSMIELLAEITLNTTAVLIFKVLIDSYINHDELVSQLTCHKNTMRWKKIKNPKNVAEYTK